MVLRFLDSLIRLVVSVVGVCLLTMIVMLSIPGNPVFSVAERGMDAAELQRRQQELSLSGTKDRLIFLSQKLLFLDFGTSRITGEDIGQELSQRLLNTGYLACLSLLLFLCLGIGAAFFAIWYQGRWPDRLIYLLSSWILATPVFWFGIVLIGVFSLNLGWFPVSGSDGIVSMILPALTVSVRPAAFLCKMLRQRLAEILDKRFIAVARAKGLSQSRILFWHVARNGLLPVITIAGMEFSQLLTGAVVAETLFALKGLGSYIVFGVESRDYDIILACVFVSGLLVCLANSLADFLNQMADPRLRQ